MTGAAGDLLWQLWTERAPLSVVDVGANPIEGDAPYKRLLDAGRARVVGFEPNPEALAALEERKSEHERYLPHALGDGARHRLHLFRHSGFTSLFPIHARNARRFGFGRATRPAGHEEIETRRLDALDEVPPVDFLKIDVQGAETMIIANGAAKLAGAVAVMSEIRFVPLYDGEPSFGDLDAELSRQGFHFHDFAFLKRVPLARRGRLKRRAFRQVVDGDAIYVRDIDDPSISDAQLFRLGLLGLDAFDSYDLALACVDRLAERGAVGAAEAERFVALLPERLRVPEALA